MRRQLAVCLSLSLVLMTEMSYAECKEYKIIDHGDRVEAVCVGEPLTEAQKKELDKQKIEQKVVLETEIEQRKTDGYDKRRTSYQDAQPSQQYPNQTTIKAEIPDAGNVVVGSYDIKYIPSNKPIRNGRQFPGEYSIKIDAKNNGRRGTVKFKLKQTDFSGYETESITFSEQFEKDQQKTVTTHLPASQVPFIQSNDWIIEAYKY